MIPSRDSLILTVLQTSEGEPMTAAMHRSERSIGAESVLTQIHNETDEVRWRFSLLNISVKEP